MTQTRTDRDPTTELLLFNLEAQTRARDPVTVAGQGDADAALDLALLLRERASGPGDVSAALHWLQVAAEGGNTEAMSELGWMLAAGLGGPAEREAALRWLDDAGQTGDTRARDLARLLRLSSTGQ